MENKLPSFKPLISGNSEPKTQIVIAESMEKLVAYFEQITNFSSRELKAISILMTNKYYANLLKFYISNKKHIKRKHAKEILKALDIIASSIKPEPIDNDNNLLKRLKGF